MTNTNALDATIVGGGMITQLQILPSLYHLQRLGRIGRIAVCSLTSAVLKSLARDEALESAFPGQTFTPYPDYRETPPDEAHPGLYKDVVAAMKPHNLVVIALPDQMHYESVIHALQHDQHVLCVKPLSLTYEHARAIEQLAHSRGLFVGIEYHKRFDDRAAMARSKYRAGFFGEFRLGMATLIEPWFYRHSNFQNWCTSEHSDMFTYIGCHYVDQVHMITGLLPVRVSVYGIEESYPNGNRGYLWTDARIVWDNNACLTVLNGMGYPDAGPGGNSQGIWLFTQGERDGGLMFHDDQYRGVKHSYVHRGGDPGASYYNEPSPDYFKLVERGGEGLTPVGYGYRSIEGIVGAAVRVEGAAAGLKDEAALEKRREILTRIDEEGLIATPANSAFNELVIEAGRKSILSGGREVLIEYGADPRVRFLDFTPPSG